jgi:hypothetical protein
VQYNGSKCKRKWAAKWFKKNADRSTKEQVPSGVEIPGVMVESNLAENLQAHCPGRERCPFPSSSKIPLVKEKGDYKIT